MTPEIRHSRPIFYKQDADLFKPIFESSHIASGRITSDFEQRFSAYIGCRGAVAANSGTSALHLGLLALGIKAEDEVIIPSYVCVSLLDAINYVRARPVLVDVDYDTFNIAPGEARRRLTPRTKAIIIPHMFGLPCDIDEFLKLGVPIIEDCAQSLGARYKAKMTGSFGVIAIFSFYATKLITTGYGGMVVSNSKKVLARIRDLGEMDKRKDYKLRYNYKLSDLQAALGISQLRRLKYFIQKRKSIAEEYTQAFSGYNLKLPVRKADREHIFYRYVIKTKKAELIKRHFRRNGIEVMPPVFKPLHRYLLMQKKRFPNTEKIYREAVSVPIYPALKKEELSRIIMVLRKAICV